MDGAQREGFGVVGAGRGLYRRNVPSELDLLDLGSLGLLNKRTKPSSLFCVTIFHIPIGSMSCAGCG